MDTLSTINLLPSNKDEVKRFSEKLISELLDGSEDILVAKRKLKCMAEIIKKVEAGIKESVLTEAEKHGKTFEYKGAEFSISLLGVKYDYTQCNDTVWNELNSQETKIKETKKQRESFLKAVNESATVVNEGTGEVETIYPPAKSGSNGIKVKLI